MTAAFLPSMEPATERREKIRRRVRPTSIAQYADGRERFKGRKADVLRWLAAYFNYMQTCPTSAELMQWATVGGYMPKFPSVTDALLYIRRGLSDLQTRGVVESVKAGKRTCRVQNTVCETWRVVPAGRSKP